MNTLMQINFRSEVLLLHDSMNVILPDDRKPGSYPVLWLLHGGGGNENDWLHQTRIRSYADKHQIAVVMPHAGYSRYCNMYWGADYFDFLTKELPQIIHHMFPRISMAREDQYIAGFSLGGSVVPRIEQEVHKPLEHRKINLLQYIFHSRFVPDLLVYFISFILF